MYSPVHTQRHDTSIHPASHEKLSSESLSYLPTHRADHKEPPIVMRLTKEPLSVHILD